MTPSTSSPAGPQFVKYFAPVIEALRDLGGSARAAEATDWVAARLGVTEEERAELTSTGIERFYNRVAWARFYLAKAGIIDSSQRGVWTLTEKGRSLPPVDHEAAMAIFREVRSQEPSDVSTVDEFADGDADAPSEGDAVSSEPHHRAEVIKALMQLSPAGFEAFAQRLLRESGFLGVTVTGRSGDGGIDGHGILEVNPLVSFRVLFQCKRYAGSVGPSVVRDFRGAMAGRADKGIILTTGSFTAEARREAVRDGAPPIELVDAEKLVSMLESLELGLKPVKAYRIDRAFFDEFQQ